MKKTTTIILAFLLAALSLTGCTNNKENDSSNDSNSSVTSSTNSSTNSSTDSTTSDDTSSDTTSSDDATSSDSANSEDNAPNDTNSENSDTESGDSEMNEPPSLDDYMFIETRAGDYVRAALSTDEWGFMSPITEELYETFLPDFDPTWAEDCCFAQTMVSANLFKVFVVKPVDNSKEDVKKWLDDYLDYCRNTAAFYPQQELQAAGAVVGETTDGYCYLICHENGNSVAEYMQANV